MLDHTTGKRNRFLLVYGSATGQAQAIAEGIAEKAPSFGLLAELHSLEETEKKFNIEREKCVVIIISSTGDGDPPDNAAKFMRRIRKRTLARDYLTHVHYALLGLGDSNYSNFCRCPRDMDSRLEELGAQRFYPTGLADDGVGLEIVADPWLEGLYPALQKFLEVTGESGMALTETVHPSSLSQADSCRTIINLEQDKSIDKTSEISLVNCDNGITNTSSIDDSRVNIELVDENSCAPFHIETVSSSESGLADDTILNICSGSKDLHNSTCNSDFGIKENLLNNAVHSELKSETVMQADGCLIKPLSSLDLNGAVIEASSNCNDVQMKVLAVSGEATKYLDSEAQQKSPETHCVPLSLLDQLSTSLPLTHPISPLSEQTLTVPLLPPPYLSTKFGGDPIQVSTLNYQNGCKLASAASDVFKVQILSAHVLTASDAVKKTLLLRLNLEGLDVTYSPGDSISIICPNNSSEVDLLLARLGLIERADATLVLSVIPDTKKRRAAIPAHVHPISTVRHIFTTCLSIREPPSKAFIRALIDHTHDELEVRRMQELCSKEGGHEYTQHIREPSISILDFLYAFPSCKPSVETVLENLPRLQPRPYSICSCPDIRPNCLDLVFNVVEIPSDKNRGHLYRRRGICTGWLDDITSSLQSGQHEDIVVEIPIFLRTNQHFRPPDDIAKPLIMIGPGTGVAPFIGFLQQRAIRRSQLTGSQVFGDSWLFYGCRNKDKDYLFRDELNKLQTTGTLTHLCVTFSRDQPEEAPTADVAAQPTRYVQDLLRLMANDICDLLTESEALIYVCGDAKNMAKDVSDAFVSILQHVKGLSADEAYMFMMKKRIHKTYFEDVWV